MKGTDILAWSLIITIIVGLLIGLGYLLVFLFVITFEALNNLMITAGAEVGLSSLVAMILTVYIFFRISKNPTVKNYIQEKREERKTKKLNRIDNNG